MKTAVEKLAERGIVASDGFWGDVAKFMESYAQEVQEEQIKIVAEHAGDYVNHHGPDAWFDSNDFAKNIPRALQ